MALQMTCPFCKREFPYDNGRLDAEITRNGQRIAWIHRRLTEIKYTRHTDDTYKEKRKLTLELTQLNERQSELKAVRKACDQQMKHAEYQIFKEFVKERLGKEEYLRLLEKVSEELQAYKLSGLMWHQYTRSNSLPNVTSINKL